MAIVKISIDNTDENIVLYNCLTSDLVTAYPTTCKYGSRMEVYNYITGLKSADLIFENGKWVNVNDKTTLKDVVDTQLVSSVLGEFIVDMDNKFVKNVKIVVGDDETYTVEMTNVPNTCKLNVQLTYADDGNITFEGVDWDNTPVLVAPNKYNFELTTDNGGVDWKGIQLDNALVVSEFVVPFGTPVAPAYATGNLGILGVVVDGETFTVGDQVYEFVADADKTVEEGNVYVDIASDTTASTGTLTMPTNPTVAVASTGTLTVDVNPSEGNTMTIGTTIYTFVDSDDFDTAGEIPIDNTLGGTQLSIVEAVNGTDGINTPHTLVTIGDFASDDAILTAKTKGAGGNAIATTETFTAGTNVFASATLTGGVTADTMTIGGVTYTFVPQADFDTAGQIPVLGNIGLTQPEVVKAINGTDTVNNPNPKVTAGAFAVNVCTLTAIIGGTVGDAITTTETFSAVGNVFGAGTLGSGADCTAPNAVTAVVTAVTDNEESDVTAVDGDADTVVFTAKVKGVSGNSIVMDEEMAHGVITETHLTGGVDGTVGKKGQMMLDATYFYCSVDVSTITTSYWEKTEHTA